LRSCCGELVHPGSLEAAEAFRDQDVVARLTDQFDISTADAEEIFLETRRWVWLCAEARKDRQRGLSVPPLIIDKLLYFIDEGWHNWILHTRAYREFCDRHFGFFVDHNPTPKRIKDARRKAVTSSSSIAQQLFVAHEIQDSYMIDKLGIDVIERWYFDLALKYDSLATRRRK
jgi:hypothetical protein